jgi:hypothetical protein
MNEVLPLPSFRPDLLGSISLLRTRAPAFSLIILSYQLDITAVNSSDIRTFLHVSEFQQISDRNSEGLFFKQFLADQGFTSVNDRALAHIHQIDVENAKNPLDCPPTRTTGNWPIQSSRNFH